MISMVLIETATVAVAPLSGEHFEKTPSFPSVSHDGARGFRVSRAGDGVRISGQQRVDRGLQQVAHQIWRRVGQSFSEHARRVDNMKCGHRDDAFRVEVRDFSKDHTVTALTSRATRRPPWATPPYGALLRARSSAAAAAAAARRRSRSASARTRGESSSGPIACRMSQKSQASGSRWTSSRAIPAPSAAECNLAGVEDGGGPAHGASG